MTDQEFVLAAAVTLELFPLSIREAIIAENSFMNQIGLPVMTTVTFSQGDNRFLAEDLYLCAQSLFDGAKHVELKEAGSAAIWDAGELDYERATFQIKNGNSEITVDGYWSLQADPVRRLSSFEGLASEFQLPRSLVDQWSAKMKAGKLSCPEIILLEQDIERSFAAISFRIRQEIEKGIGNLHTLVPSDPVFWRTVYPFASDATAHAEFIEQEVKTRIIAGRKAYGVKFYEEALRLCVHSSVAAAIGNESLSKDECTKLAEHVERSGSMFSKLGFVEVMLAQDDLDISLQKRVADIIDFFLDEADEGRFELLSNLFFFVSGQLSLSSSFDGSPVFARRLIEFSHASFLEEILISEGVEANTAAFDLAQRVAHRAFVVGHLDAHTETRWTPEFATPHQLKAEFISRLNNAVATTKLSLKGTPLEKFIKDGSDKRLSEKLKFPYSFLPGPLEGGTEKTASLPDDWKALIESELKKNPPGLGGFNGIVNGGVVFELPAELVALSVAALRNIDLAADDDRNFSIGAFVDGLARVAAVCRNKQLADEVWHLTHRVMRKKPEAFENRLLFSLPATLSAAHEVSRRDSKLVEMIEFLSHCRLTKEQSGHFGACIRDLLDMRPDLWVDLGKVLALLEAQQL